MKVVLSRRSKMLHRYLWFLVFGFLALNGPLAFYHGANPELFFITNLMWFLILNMAFTDYLGKRQRQVLTLISVIAFCVFLGLMGYRITRLL